MIPGGFSGGDEPDGSAKFITAFFRAPAVTEAVRDLLKNRDGLMLGICNGFQALIKLGLVPFGDIVPMTAECPTLTFNTIGRHQSRLVRTRVASNLSPWLAKTAVGDVYTVAISHGEGRFVASDEVLAQLKANGQIATQYVDESGVPSMDLGANPNGSLLAIEGITSPDGRVFGKMGHSERSGNGLYVNVPGNQVPADLRGRRGVLHRLISVNRSYGGADADGVRPSIHIPGAAVPLLRVRVVIPMSSSPRDNTPGQDTRNQRKYKVLFFGHAAHMLGGMTVMDTTPPAGPGTATPTRGPRTLAGCRAGDTVIVDGIDLDERHRFRLMELGLRAGVVIRVVQRSGFGGRVVARGPERIALDGGTARAIRVRISDDTEEMTR